MNIKQGLKIIKFEAGMSWQIEYLIGGFKMHIWS